MPVLPGKTGTGPPKWRGRFAFAAVSYSVGDSPGVADSAGVVGPSSEVGVSDGSSVAVPSGVADSPGMVASASADAHSGYW